MKKEVKITIGVIIHLECFLGWFWSPLTDLRFAGCDTRSKTLCNKFSWKPSISTNFAEAVPFEQFRHATAHLCQGLIA
jgi:hypothetical protein